MIVSRMMRIMMLMMMSLLKMRVRMGVVRVVDGVFFWRRRSLSPIDDSMTVEEMILDLPLFEVFFAVLAL